MDKPIGKRRWVIAEGYIPPDQLDKSRQLTSHEAACLLNVADQDAHVQLMIYFSDREPAGPFRLTVPARRTLHMRFNDLEEPERIARGKDYSTVIDSDVPIVVQHTRLDSRSSQISWMTALAFPAE